MAEFPDQKIHSVIEGSPLPKFTEKTITNSSGFSKEIEEIRERGVAFSGGEQVEGLHAIDVAVTDHHDRVQGAISIAGPRKILKNEKIEEEMIEAVMNSVNVIELKLID